MRGRNFVRELAARLDQDCGRKALQRIPFEGSRHRQAARDGERLEQILLDERRGEARIVKQQRVVPTELGPEVLHQVLPVVSAVEERRAPAEAARKPLTYGEQGVDYGAAVLGRRQAEISAAIAGSERRFVV